MHESIVFCSTCTMSSQRKFKFAISSPDEFLVVISSCGLVATSLSNQSINKLIHRHKSRANRRRAVATVSTKRC